MKIAVIGCGLRTPLLVHGIAHAPDLRVNEVALFDVDHSRSGIMAALGRHIANGSDLRLHVARTVDEAVEDAAFVVSSFRAGGMEARAKDERLAVDHGFAGQETTGPAGCAMALRSIPVAVEYARTVEKRAPRAWIVNFTNPAGIVTQAGYQGAYGNLIVVDHGFGLETRYGHLSSFNVQKGAHVTRGEMIGRLGATGRTTGNHLHYEVMANGRLLNPLQLLTQQKPRAQ